MTFFTLSFSLRSLLSLSLSLPQLQLVSLIHSLTDTNGSGDLLNQRGVAAASAAAAVPVVPRCHLPGQPPVGRRVTRRERVCQYGSERASVLSLSISLSKQSTDRPTDRLNSRANTETTMMAMREGGREEEKERRTEAEGG